MRPRVHLCLSYLSFLLGVNCIQDRSSSKYKLHNVSDERMKYMEDMYPELFSNKFQGDILQTEDDIGGLRNAVKDEKYRWPEGIIPYEFHSDFGENERLNVSKAMSRLSNETCIRFVPHANETHFVTIYKYPKAGCFSVIGYHSDANDTHKMNLESPGCLRHQGTIEHEFLHLIGLFHEQSRSDRDDYVIIYWGNITEENQFNFRKVTDDDAVTYDIPYDIGSVMHYPRFAFSKNGNDTIVYKKDPQQEMGQRIGATENDLNKVRKMYKCDYKSEPYPGEWFVKKLNSIFKNPF